MYFTLSRKTSPGHWTMLGYVIAANAKEAEQKLGLRTTHETARDGEVFIDLQDSKGNEYLLESLSEITSPFDG